MKDVEIWKDIKFVDLKNVEHDYTGFYQVSNKGRVRSLSKNTRTKNKDGIMNPKPHKTNGYVTVKLCKNGVCAHIKVHKLVAFMFLGYPHHINSDETICINHINEIKHDNRVDNLEWCTAKQNSNHGTHPARISARMKGIKRSEEWRRNNSLSKIGKMKGKAHPNSRSIVGVNIKSGGIIRFDCLSDTNDFFNKKHAAQNVSVSVNSHHNGGDRTAYGYRWFYEEDYKEDSK